MVLFNFLHTSFKSNKKLLFALKETLGLSFSLSNQLCCLVGLNSFSEIKNLTLEALTRIQNFCSLNYLTSSKLLDFTEQQIKALVVLKFVKGYQHTHRLPVRGQRTRTNRKTARRLSFYA
jgi:small subunit ribosomal protein S13